MDFTLLGIGSILLASRLLVAAMGIAHRYSRLKPEILRKLMHAGMGTILLSCPFFFHHSWPVMMLCAVFIALLAARNWSPSLNHQITHVIDGVGRTSAGEFYFPLAVALLFALAGSSLAEFCLPLALLSYADSAAALVGIRWGKCVFRTPGGRKSVEGCAAFFIVAFALCSAFLLPNRSTPVIESLLIAFNIALLTTLLEAASWHGLDNLAIPLSAWMMLHFLPTPGGQKLFVVLATAAGVLLLTKILRAAPAAANKPMNLAAIDSSGRPLALQLPTPCQSVEQALP